MLTPTFIQCFHYAEKPSNSDELIKTIEEGALSEVFAVAVAVSAETSSISTNTRLPSNLACFLNSLPVNIF